MFIDGSLQVYKGLIRINWVAEGQTWHKILMAVKDLPDATFRKKPGPHWRIPARTFHAKKLIDAISDWDFVIDSTILALIDASSESTKPPDVSGLYPYQIDAVAFLNRNNGRAIIGDGVGLGKTMEALGWAWLNKIDNILVVCPANVIFKWKREILDPEHRFPWAGKWTARVITKTSESLDSSAIHIMSYDIMRRKVAELVKIPHSLIIIDESHMIKNFRSLRTKATQLIAKDIPHILALSGTPLLNRPIEMFSLLHMLDPKGWPSVYGYGKRYCGGKDEWGGYNGASNIEELGERLSHVMIRRMKKDVKSDMPELTISVVPVTVPLSDYNKVAANVMKAIIKLSPDSKGYWINVLDRLNLLRKAAGDAKAEVTIQWAKDFFAENDDNTKLVIYAHHHDIIDRIREGLTDYGVTSITGKVNPKIRDENAHRFQTKMDERVMIISMAGGVGIDLFGIGDIDISNLLIAELEWRPSDLEQAIGRLDRAGQTLPVNAWILEARDTIDEYMAETVANKEIIIDKVLGAPSIAKTIIKDIIGE